MRILWLTVNRDERVAQLFTPLRKAVEIEAEKQGHEIHVTERLKWSIPQIWGEQHLDQMLIPSISNGFDILFTDASFAFMTEPWDEITIPKCVLMEDQHGPLVKHYMCKFLTEFGFDYLFTRYRDALKTHWPAVFSAPYNRIQVRWLPHAIDPMRFFDDPTIPDRDIGVLTSGCIGEQTYPLRHALHEACNGRVWYHREKRQKEGTGCWEQWNKYTALLNRAVMAVQGFSIYGYPTAKTFEIPACGAILLLTEQSEEAMDLGFESGTNCLHVEVDTPEQRACAARSIGVCLNGDGTPLSQIAQAGHDLVHERHTIQVRAKDLIRHFEEIVNAV